MGGIDELDRFQRYLGDEYQIVVYALSPMTRDFYVWYRGEVLFPAKFYFLRRPAL